MGSANLAVIERFFDAINRRDLDAIEALCHPEVETDASTIGVDLGRYSGRAGMVEYLEQLWAAGEISLAVAEAVESGARVAVVVDLRRRGGASGIAMDGRYGAWYELRDGLIAVARIFPAFDDALADAGIAAER
jgi:ketosteroid isomerase-like protein